MDYQQQVICSYFLKSLPTRSFPLPDSLRFFFLDFFILMAPEIKIFMIWQWFGAVWIGDMNGGMVILELNNKKSIFNSLISIPFRVATFLNINKK